MKKTAVLLFITAFLLTSCSLLEVERGVSADNVSSSSAWQRIKVRISDDFEYKGVKESGTTMFAPSQAGMDSGPTGEESLYMFADRKTGDRVITIYMRQIHTPRWEFTSRRPAVPAMEYGTETLQGRDFEYEICCSSHGSQTYMWKSMSQYYGSPSRGVFIITYIKRTDGCSGGFSELMLFKNECSMAFTIY